MRNRLPYGIAIAALALLSGTFVHAQDTASINGTVRDPAGASVVNAQIAVTNTERGINRTTTTNSGGEYSVGALPVPAAYNVTVTAAGFKKYEAKGVVLSVAQKARVDVALQVGAASIEMTVEGSTVAQVETQSSELSGTVTGQEISQLQLNGRNFTQLVTLVPGVSNQTGADEATVGITGSVQYSINGGRTEYNNWELDGGDNMDNGSNASLNVYPSIDAIAEFKVLTSNYGAQYGRNGSGTVETELKSGTSSFHGDIYEFVRNDDFNARNYFESSVPPYKKNDFGGTLGGPIYIPGLYNENKQRTFFFYSEEWRREIQAGQVFNQPVPYSQERTGNFSDVCPDPNDTFANCPVEPAFLPNGAANPLAGQYFPGNQVPVSAAGTSLLALIPVGTVDQPANSTYIASPTQPTTWREELFRIDHNLTEHNRVSFHYVHDSWDQVQSSTLWTGSSFPTVQTDFKGPAISLLARITSTISPTLLNEFVASYTTDHLVFHSTGTPNPDAWQLPAGGLAMSYLFANGYGGKLPAISVNGGTEYGSNGFYMDPDGLYPEGPYNSNPTYTYRDNMTKVLGKHTLQFGAYFVAAQKNELSTNQVNGSLAFTTSSTVTTGNPFADLLMGEIGTFTQASGQLKFYNRYKIFEPYIQDDWRATPRLTLNIGLRVSMMGTYRERYHHAFNWEPGVYSAADAPEIDIDGSITGIPGNLVPGVGNPYDGLVQCGVTPGVPVSCSKGHLFNPSPRIGFAFDPKGDGKTAIRGGYGIFFEHTNGEEANTESLEGQSSPLLQVASQLNIPSYQGIGAAGSLPPFTFTSLPNQVVWPYVQQWHLDIQHELPQHTVLTVAYVGSEGTHLTRQRDINQLHSLPLSQNPYAAGQVVNGGPYAQTNPNWDCSWGPGGAQSGVTLDQYGVPTNAVTSYGTPIPYTPGVGGGPPSGAAVNLFVACGNIVNFFRPYYGIDNITLLENAASSNYNGLEISAVRTMGGLTLDVAYTYSHSIDNASDRLDSGFLDSYNPNGNRASSSFDVRQQLNVGYVYDLPFFKNHGLSHTLLGSWQWSGIASYASGTPFSIVNTVAPTDNAGAGNGVSSAAAPVPGSFADKIGNPNSGIPPTEVSGGGSTYGPYLYNPNAYTQPRGLTFGDSGRNSLRNPHRTNFDMALFKRFAVTESKAFEFRAEAFNVFNHTEWLPIYGDAGAGANITSSGTNEYAGPYTGPGSTNQFQALGAHNARILQLGAKFII